MTPVADEESAKGKHAKTTKKSGRVRRQDEAEEMEIEKDATRTPDQGRADEELMWRIIRAYFHRHGLVRHQIESYNNFMTVVLPHIIRESSEIRVRATSNGKAHLVSICNVSVQKPVMQERDGYDRPVMPHVARIRSATYSVAVMVDIVHDILKAEDQTHEERRIYREVLLCRLPAMVGSMYCHTHDSSRENECKLDQGGYFIINGIEKVMLAQEKLHTNQAYIFPARQPSKYKLVAEIRSCHELKLRSTSTLYIYMTHTKKGAIPGVVAQVPFLEMTMPLLALFRLVGVETKEDVFELVVGNTNVEASRLLCAVLDNDPTSDMKAEDVLDWIGREGTKETTKEKRQKYLDHIVTNEILPHCGLTLDPDVKRAKACYLGYMVRKLVRAWQGELELDDRDHYANKRIDTAGTAMSLLFRQVYRALLKSFSLQLLRHAEAKKLEYTNVGELLSSRKITNAFKYALSTGNWGLQRGKAAQTGVAQMMSRMTAVAALSNLRRINTPINREGRAPKPRQLHYTSWGIVCPVETPEGTSCGLVKNLAMMTHVRVGSYSGAVRETLDRVDSLKERLVPLLSCSAKQRAEGSPILVNGALHSYTSTEEEAESLLVDLREMRRKNDIPFDTTLALVDGAVYIDTDPGAMLRPLLVASCLKNISSLVESAPSFSHLWDFLVTNGAIEYVDKHEESNLLVGQLSSRDDETYTHYELDPSLINGLCASLIPFADHNQAPRNCYQSAMGKQAVGLYALNYPIRMEAVSHVLCSPQRPLVSTRMEEALHLHDAPTGVNAMVVIMCYSGFNQEDSLIVNQSALERGLFRSVKYQTYKDEERANGADVERFENPKLAGCQGMRIGCYDKLSPSGMPTVGAEMKAGDVILGKTITTTEVGEGARRVVKRDRCVMVKPTEEATIDAVMTSFNRDGSRLVKVRTRSTRTPIVGDKLSSRHGQKGVIGIVLKEEDMPFTEDGQIPDIIVNPHAIPSRMTIGQLMECLLGKLCSVKGQIGDATPFRGTSIDQISSELVRHGQEELGRETFHNGATGKRMKGKVFFGPTYYQRLKHMVKDKHHSRSRGPVQILTRQPVEGRARDGGLRMGEMERDCALSHGSANLLSERLVEQSDPFISHVCSKCGLLALPAAEKTLIRNRRPYCPNCKGGDVHEVRMPYAFKLLLQEMMALNIAARLRLKLGESGEEEEAPPPIASLLERPSVN